MNKWNVLALGSLDTNQSNIISSSQQFAYWHYVIVTTYLYYNCNTVLTLHLIIYWHHDCKMVYSYDTHINIFTKYVWKMQGVMMWIYGLSYSNTNVAFSWCTFTANKALATNWLAECPVTAVRTNDQGNDCSVATNTGDLASAWAVIWQSVGWG
jgi:hypothetical protein